MHGSRSFQVENEVVSVAHVHAEGKFPHNCDYSRHFYCFYQPCIGYCYYQHMPTQERMLQQLPCDNLRLPPSSLEPFFTACTSGWHEKRKNQLLLITMIHNVTSPGKALSLPSLVFHCLCHFHCPKCNPLRETSLATMPREVVLVAVCISIVGWPPTSSVFFPTDSDWQNAKGVRCISNNESATGWFVYPYALWNA